MADYHQFPISLPGPEVESMSWAPLFDNRIRSQMDVGIKTRRRVTFVPKKFGCALYCSPAELQTLLDFYELTLREVEPFEWYDYRRPNNTQQRALYCFDAEPAYTQPDVVYRVELQLTLLRPVIGSFPISNEAGAVLVDGDDNGLAT